MRWVVYDDGVIELVLTTNPDDIHVTGATTPGVQRERSCYSGFP